MYLAVVEQLLNHDDTNSTHTSSPFFTMESVAAHMMVIPYPSKRSTILSLKSLVFIVLTLSYSPNRPNNNKSISIQSRIPR